MKNHLSDDLTNGIGGRIEGFEKVIGAPFDDIFNVIELSSSFVFRAVFDYTPTQHSHGECFWEMELYRISGVVIPADEIF